MDLSPIANAVAAIGGGLRQFRAPGWTWEARRGDYPAASIVHVWRGLGIRWGRTAGAGGVVYRSGVTDDFVVLES